MRFSISIESIIHWTTSRFLCAVVLLMCFWCYDDEYMWSISGVLNLYCGWWHHCSFGGNQTTTSSQWRNKEHDACLTYRQRFCASRVPHPYAHGGFCYGKEAYINIDICGNMSDFRIYIYVELNPEWTEFVCWVYLCLRQQTTNSSKMNRY